MRTKKYIPTQPNPQIAMVLTKGEISTLQVIADLSGVSLARIARGLLRAGLREFKSKNSPLSTTDVMKLGLM